MKLIIRSDGGVLQSTSEEGPIASAFVAKLEDGTDIASLSKLHTGTVNIAEYHGLGMAIVNLPKILEHYPNIDFVSFISDSQLIVNQVMKRCSVHKPHLKILCDFVIGLLQRLPVPWSLHFERRINNDEADYLCDIALKGILKENLFEPLPRRPKKLRKAQKPKTKPAITVATFDAFLDNSIQAIANNWNMYQGEELGTAEIADLYSWLISFFIQRLNSMEKESTHV